jgi:hypothetical protein
MTKPISIKAIEKETGKSWDEWVKTLDDLGARDMPHKDIAQKVSAMGVPGWWTQSVTVAYEQHIGRRVPGQESDGTFTVNASKTFEGTMDQALTAWEYLIADLDNFNGVAISGSPRLSKTERYRNWRCDLADGSRVVVGIYEKSPGKSVIPLAHEKITKEADVEPWRIYWKDLLAGL